jgi:hypothetical protein
MTKIGTLLDVNRLTNAVRNGEKSLQLWEERRPFSLLTSRAIWAGHIHLETEHMSTPTWGRALNPKDT